MAFALSGVILARKENYDIFGAFVLASLPAMGGGVLRDLLSERYPIGILRSPETYIVAVIGTVLFGALCFKVIDLIESRRPAARDTARSRWGTIPQRVVIVCDAMGLAAFTVTGVVIAIEQRCEPLWLWGPS